MKTEGFRNIFTILHIIVKVTTIILTFLKITLCHFCVKDSEGDTTTNVSIKEKLQLDLFIIAIH